MPKKLGTRIASGLIAALMFMQTISTSVVTAYAADVTSGSDVVSSDVPSDTSTANTLNDSSGSEGEQTPNDESQAPEESGNDESSSATQSSRQLQNRLPFQSKLRLRLLKQRKLPMLQTLLQRRQNRRQLQRLT